MRTDAVQKVIELCRELRDEELSVILQEVTLLQAGFASTQSASIRDVVPIDVPIQHSIDVATGDLDITYPFSIGLGRCIGWKKVRVTQAAQEALAHILYEALSDGESVARIPPTPTNLQ